jgi:hypothetical protein
MASLTWPDFSPILSVEVPAMAALVASCARRLLVDIAIGNEPDCRDVLDDVRDAFPRRTKKNAADGGEVSGGRSRLGRNGWIRRKPPRTTTNSLISRKE